MLRKICIFIVLLGCLCYTISYAFEMYIIVFDARIKCPWGSGILEKHQVINAYVDPSEFCWANYDEANDTIHAKCTQYQDQEDKPCEEY